MAEEQIKKLLTQLENHEKRITTLEGVARDQKSVVDVPSIESEDKSDVVLSIVNKTGDCDEADVIQSKVMDQHGMEAKILLCFYISHKYFDNVWLTTGDIEKITSDLGIKVDVGNVSNKIKKTIRQYLESGATRKKGQPTPYRLNRKGVKRFEEIIRADEK